MDRVVDLRNQCCLTAQLFGRICLLAQNKSFTVFRKQRNNRTPLLCFIIRIEGTQ